MSCNVNERTIPLSSFSCLVYFTLYLFLEAYSFQDLIGIFWTFRRLSIVLNSLNFVAFVGGKYSVIKLNGLIILCFSFTRIFSWYCNDRKQTQYIILMPSFLCFFFITVNFYHILDKVWCDNRIYTQLEMWFLDYF